jgi:hypothetical protein
MKSCKEKDSLEYIKETFPYSDVKRKQESILFLCRKICDEIILKRILSILLSQEYQPGESGILRNDMLFVDFYTIEKNYLFTENVKTNIEKHFVELRDNGFLAFPSNRESLIRLFKNFGNDNIPWQSDANHRITLIKPFNIYFVEGGHHSIACGKFFNKEGKIECDSAIDYTNILKQYDYKEGFFIDKNGKKINKVLSKELLDLFFLGKIIIEMET